MNFRKKIVIITALALAVLAMVLGSTVSRPELYFSIIVRLLAACISLFLIIRFREWRIVFLMFMFILMAFRQILTLLIWLGILQTNSFTRRISEIPGYAVTLLSLISIIYIGLILRKQKKDIQTLAELIPICSNCGKVRDDKGYWNKLESYLESRSRLRFTHGICKDCADKLYGDKEWYTGIKEK